MSYGAQSMTEKRSTVDPYYMKGDVFQRDQKYYDQLLQKRSRSPHRSNMQPNTTQHQPQQYNTQYTTQVDSAEMQRLREENISLLNQIQKVNYGGEFGNGDEVIKKQYYNSSSAENSRIREQEKQINSLEQTVKANNEKLVKYQQAAHELEVRIGNIQAIDKQIYRQLKGASLRDKELLERASNALAREEPKENVIRILEQVINS